MRRPGLGRAISRKRATGARLKSDDRQPTALRKARTRLSHALRRGTGDPELRDKPAPRPRERGHYDRADAIRDRARVSTSTGRSPPGVAANQISPRCMSPVCPVLCGTPVGDLGQRSLTWVQRHPLPCVGIVLATESDEVTVECVAQELRAVDTKRVGPALHLGRLVVWHPEAQHRHTIERVSCMTALAWRIGPYSAHWRRGVDPVAIDEMLTSTRPQCQCHEG